MAIFVLSQKSMCLLSGDKISGLSSDIIIDKPGVKMNEVRETKPLIVGGRWWWLSAN